MFFCSTVFYFLLYQFDKCFIVNRWESFRIMFTPDHLALICARWSFVHGYLESTGQTFIFLQVISKFIWKFFVKLIYHIIDIFEIASSTTVLNFNPVLCWTIPFYLNWVRCDSGCYTWVIGRSHFAPHSIIDCLKIKLFIN